MRHAWIHLDLSAIYPDHPNIWPQLRHLVKRPKLPIRWNKQRPSSHRSRAIGELCGNGLSRLNASLEERFNSAAGGVPNPQSKSDGPQATKGNQFYRCLRHRLRVSTLLHHPIRSLPTNGYNC